MREYLKNKELEFEETVFYRLYKDYKNNIDFKSALGLSFDDNKMDLLKKQLSFKKQLGKMHFYYDKFLFSEYERSQKLDKLRDINFAKNKNNNMLTDVNIVCTY